MKNLHFLILFFTIILTPNLILAQKIVLGPELGYGFGWYYSSNNNNEGLTYLPKYTRIGVTCFIKPEDPGSTTNIYYKTGLLYNRISWKDKNLNFAQIPIGVDFRIGKKITSILGGGFTLNYLFLQKHFDSEFVSTRNLFQFGGYLNTGIGFKISDRIQLDFKGQIGRDFTTLFTHKILTGHYLQSNVFLEEKIIYGIVSTSVSFSINKK